MAKFPTEVEESIVVSAAPDRTYAFLWDVAGSARCIPGIDRCDSVGPDTYRFLYQERSTGPVSMVLRYTAKYRGNGKDEISFEGISADGDNCDVRGRIRLAAEGAGTRISMKQMLAPDTPVPRLLQTLIRSFVEAETSKGMRDYLAGVQRALGAR